MGSAVRTEIRQVCSRGTAAPPASVIKQRAFLGWAAAPADPPQGGCRHPQPLCIKQRAFTTHRRGHGRFAREGRGSRARHEGPSAARGSWICYFSPPGPLQRGVTPKLPRERDPKQIRKPPRGGWAAVPPGRHVALCTKAGGAAAPAGGSPSKACCFIHRGWGGGDSPFLGGKKSKLLYALF
jgi:hypothetical protein